MRVLMVIHTPWSENLGAPRVQMELARELRQRGHEVEKFSWEDAFPERPTRGAAPSRLRVLLTSNRSFARRAVEHVRRHGHRFDIVEANQTDLPVPKTALGFDGLVVTRSQGLIPAYEAFEREAARRWPRRAARRPLRALARWLLTWPGRRRRRRDVTASFRHADVILVQNRDEEATLTGWGEPFASKVRRVPLGLTEERREALGAAALDPEARRARRTVAFVGAWSPRKGSMDWPAVADRVLARAPDAHFRLLGTGFDADTVRAGFSAAAREAVEVVPSFEHRRLPEHLADATVGAFPGYLEGFGLGALEMLAAGLPTVGYDAPGSRETLGATEHPSLVPVGDTAALGDRLAELLTLPADDYAARADDARATAARFRWPEMAERTEAVYRRGLEALGRDTDRAGARGNPEEATS